jgi:phospholipid/cholesterol/gamma-HCH transport system substrate-binding protein
MTGAQFWRSARYKIYGALLLAIVLALIVASGAYYDNKFSSSVMISVRADRSGLLLDPGSDVTLRGVTVGKVRSVTVDRGGALLKVALQPDKAKYISSNVTADIQAPTVFGAKFVDLEPPAADVLPGPAIAAGDTIQPAVVSIEVNDVFQNLITLLDAVDPTKINTILGSIATSLKGNGEATGQTIAATNQLTSQLDQHVSALKTDLARSAPVLHGYSSVTPALVSLLQNIGVFSDTLVQSQQHFQSSLVDVNNLAGTAQQLLHRNQHGVEKLLRTTKPIAQVLNTYAPTLPCVINGTTHLSHVLDPILGGNEPGLHVLAGFLPGAAGYNPSKDLPIIDSVDGPDCLGAPLSSAVVSGHRVAKLANGQLANPYPHIKFRDGTTTAFADKTDCLSAPNTNGACITPQGKSSDTTSLLTLLNNLIGGGVIGR